jgi:hypothetical protein
MHGTGEELPQRQADANTSACSPPQALEPRKTIDDPTRVVPPRRGFLRLLAVTAAGAAALLGLPAAAPAKPKRKKNFRGVLAYRLTTRRHRSCNACKRHHRYMLFRTHALADANRAHPGCNCPIIRHKVRAKHHKRLFGRRGVAPSGIVDLRKIGLDGKPRG